MKNLLNEEINKMKYLLNYDRGLTLTEQKNVISEDSAPGGLGGDWNPSTGEYTIVKGDTLSKIGKAFGVKWMDIWEENKDTLRSGQPNCGRYCGYNWIFVGEVVTIPGKAETITTQTDTTVDTTVDTTTTIDTTATDTPVVVPVTTTADEEPKTKREIRRDCRDEAKNQGLKRFTKERRDFMRKCKAEGGINAESDEENTPAEDEQTRKEKRQEKRQTRKDCRAEAKKLGLKGKERREFMRKCKAEGGYDSDTQIQSQNVTPTFETTDIEKTLINSIPGETIKEYNDLQTKNEGSEVGISRSMSNYVSEDKARTSAQTKLSKKFNTQTLEGVTNIKLTQVNAKPETDGYLYIGLWSKPTNV